MIAVCERNYLANTRVIDSGLNIGYKVHRFSMVKSMTLDVRMVVPEKLADLSFD